MRITYIAEPCPRCGSKQKITKRWKEKVPTFTGTIVVDCSQIECSNKECQAAFDKNLREENIKQKAQKLKKEQEAQLRQKAKDELANSKRQLSAK